MKPKILLALNKKREYYINAVNNCGAEAVAEYCPKYSDEYDGLILCGGNDIGPEYYNESMDGAVNIDNDRDKAEFEVLEKFLESGKPVMGICRGYQLINVAFGGTLHQHITNASEHTSSSENYSSHKIIAKEGSCLFDLYGREFNVNTSHHQAVKKLGTGLEVTALAADGVTIEGIEHRELPIIGVQFHPEKMCFELKTDELADGAKIFRHFIRMCSDV